MGGCYAHAPCFQGNGQPLRVNDVGSLGSGKNGQGHESRGWDGRDRAQVSRGDQFGYR